MSTIRDLILAVRKLAAAHPNNHYKKDPTETRCSYDKGSCDNGSVGCIFGQALNALGHSVTGTTSIVGVIIDSGLIESRIDVPPSPALSWCSVVQQRQDRHESWADAVHKADIAFPGIATIVEGNPWPTNSTPKTTEPTTVESCPTN
jgi:hypothetical protein